MLWQRIILLFFWFTVGWQVNVSGQVSDEKRPHGNRLGVVSEKPNSGRSVKIKDGFMVPYKTKIPGTDIEFEMIPIPGGRFTMGSPDSEIGREDDEGPQFEVKVSPFWMGKYEVTWAEYMLFMQLDTHFKSFQSKGLRKVSKVDDFDTITAPSSLYEPTFTFEAGQEPNQPAATMSQFAAKQYTKWLSLISNQFYRLPTESEWEYACRAGTTTAYYFGEDADDLDDHAWHIDNSDELRHAVGQLKPNPWGLYDMYGNVAEWVLDGYEENAYERFKNKNPSALETWNRPTEVFPRVLRGGSWEFDTEYCRSAARIYSEEEWRDEDPNYPQSPWWFTTTPALGTGFRIIRPLESPTSAAEREPFWSAGLPRILADAKNRIMDNGRGAFGIVDPTLPKAIQDLKKKK
ncbi:MAG: formylglycine-generating enzyme family protein [Planctomycetota bacterium]